MPIEAAEGMVQMGLQQEVGDDQPFMVWADSDGRYWAIDDFFDELCPASWQGQWTWMEE